MPWVCGHMHAASKHLIPKDPLLIIFCWEFSVVFQLDACPLSTDIGMAVTVSHVISWPYNTGTAQKSKINMKQK